VSREKEQGKTVYDLELDADGQPVKK